MIWLLYLQAIENAIANSWAKNVEDLATLFIGREEILCNEVGRNGIVVAIEIGPFFEGVDPLLHSSDD